MESATVFHVVAGGLGLFFGVIALLSWKGHRAHRLAGNAFFFTMLAMGISGFALAATYPVHISMLAASLSVYLVLSGTISARQRGPNPNLGDGGVTVFGIVVFLYGLFLSWRAANGIADQDGDFTFPAETYYAFTAIGLLAVSGDAWILLRGRRRGRLRTMRHAWRMCIPLFIAASSLFAGQQQVFPERWQGTIYLQIPQFAVLLVMAFYLVTLGFNRPYRKRAAMVAAG